MAVYKRQLKKGLRWWYKFDYKNITYSSKAEYLTKVEARKGEAERLANLKKQKQEKISFLNLCNLRLDLIKTKSDYYYRDHQLVLRPLIKKWGRLDVNGIEKKMVIAHFTDMSNELAKRGKDNYLVNKSIRILKAMFYWAIDDLEVMDKNPAKIKLFPIDRKLKYIPPDKDIKIVLEKCNEEQKRLIKFVMDTGARISEALRVADTDFKNGFVVLWTRKNKRGDLIPRYVPYKPDFEIKDGKIFYSWTGYPRFLEMACREAKIKLFGWHALRHRYASKLANEKMPLIQIRDLLGHQDITTTNIYLQSILGYDFASDYNKNMYC
ncbi:MAG TPA: site-specific integrase [Syntrophales bacterium]|nr:site-specific integrase [Syntrophales bacterium]